MILWFNLGVVYSIDLDKCTVTPICQYTLWYQTVSLLYPWLQHPQIQPARYCVYVYNLRLESPEFNVEDKANYDVQTEEEEMESKEVPGLPMDRTHETGSLKM